MTHVAYPVFKNIVFSQFIHHATVMICIFVFAIVAEPRRFQVYLAHSFNSLWRFELARLERQSGLSQNSARLVELRCLLEPDLLLVRTWQSSETFFWSPFVLVHRNTGSVSYIVLHWLPTIKRSGKGNHGHLQLLMQYFWERTELQRHAKPAICLR